MSMQAHPQAENLVSRAKSILLQPSATWDAISAEPATIKSLFTGYVMILTAIGPVCRAVGQILFGDRALGMVYRPGLISILVGAVVSYLMMLAGVYVLGLIANALAPSFNGRKDQVQAMKVAAYSGTPGWLAGVFYLIPALGALAIIGELYALYVLYRGLPKLMQAPEDKALGYTALVVVAYIVIVILVVALTASFAAIA